MDYKANYAVVGFFLIVLFAGLVTGFVWLSNYSNRAEFKNYLVYVQGGVVGLTIDSPIFFNGVKVGSVDKIELDEANPQLVKLHLKIKQDVPITKSTVATLIPQGITGLVYVGLSVKSPNAPLLTAENGQELPVITYEKPLITQVTEVLPDLTKNLGDIAEGIKKALTDQNMNNLAEMLNHLNSITRDLDQQTENFNSSMKSLQVFLQNGAKASQRFEDTISTAQQAADQLKKTSNKISLSVNTLNQQMMPGAEELIRKMNDTSSNLQQITQDLKSNPSILIRGKTPSPPGPGE
ncbi:MAG: MCE family protein [Proteobacteria bacterium]|nr:MCE family protein [Pseudomonadota bacterium]